MSGNVELIKKLRDQTGAGMSACKSAIEEAGGDYEKAVKILREKGIANAAKKGDREMKEGICGVRVLGSSASLIRISCETDFVVKSDKFRALANDVLLAISEAKATNLESGSASKLKSGASISDEIANNVGVIGENISLNAVEMLSTQDGIVVSYLHGAINENFGKIAVALAIESSGDKGKLEEMGKKICMQIAALNPQFLSIAEVSADFIKSEKEIYAKQMEGSDKKPEIVEKIIDGRLQKTHQECVLLEQEFIMDPKQKVKDFLAQTAKEIGSEIKLVKFVRLGV